MSDINKLGKDVGDAIKEGVHRGEADSERAKRTVAGDEMTPGEKAGSIAKEIGSDVKADIDKSKRTIRDNT
jgi:hypothetical protein